ncbi:MAG: sugar phosphate isomerase/epimerase [Bryobacterales bacterium]|nr:sugar phosphate isomerase/epimerase [Bryobacterales bacterium]
MERALSSHLVVNHRMTVAWLDRVLEAGVNLVEFFCARQSLDYRDHAQIGELGHWFRDCPLKLHSIHSPMYSDDCWGRTGPQSVINIADVNKMARRSSVDEIKRALEIAEVIPFRYMIQHLGVGGEEYDDRKLDAAFSSLEELNVFARQRGVDILLENIPNRLSSAERLLYFLGITHLDNKFCFDVGHAHIMGGVEREFDLMKDRIRSTHIHDNDGTNDIHLFPKFGEGGNIDWKTAIRQLRTRERQYPLLLELREAPTMAQPLDKVRQVFDYLEAIPNQDYE